jgi:hypothetical protein
MSKPEDFKFDSRVRERLLRGRSLSTADLQRHLEALPDLEGEYEVLNDPQPAVTPPRDHAEEPLMFDGIRRLQALTEPHAPARPSASSVASSAAVAPPRELPGRGLGAIDVGRGPSPALRSALMESEISGVGAGAVSAALGAMSAEARTAAGFPPVVPVPMAPASPPEEPQTPVTLRSRAAPEGLGAEDASGVADWEAPYPDSEDMT